MEQYFARMGRNGEKRKTIGNTEKNGSRKREKKRRTIEEKLSSSVGQF